MRPCICNVIMKCVLPVFLSGEVPCTVSQRMDDKTVYVNKALRSESSAIAHATKRRTHVSDMVIFAVISLVGSRHLLTI